MVGLGLPPNLVIVKSPRQSNEPTKPTANNTSNRAPPRPTPANNQQNDEDSDDDEIEEIHTSRARQQHIYSPQQPSPYFADANGNIQLVPPTQPQNRGNFVFLAGDRHAIDRFASLCCWGLCCLICYCIFIPLVVIIGLLVSVLLKRSS